MIINQLGHRLENASSSFQLLREFWRRNFFSHRPGRSEREVRKSLLELGYLLSGGDLQRPDCASKIDLLSNPETDLEQIQRDSLWQSQKVLMFEALIEAFSLHQRGQKQDLTLRMDQIEPSTVRQICCKSLEMRSGTLVHLFLKLGSLVHSDSVFSLGPVSQKLGMAMQIIEDVACLQLDRQDTKLLKDMILRRPNWVWVVLAENYSESDWRDFRKAVESLPQTAPLEEVLRCSHLKEQAFNQAREEFAHVLQKLKSDFNLAPDSQVYKLALELGNRFTASIQ